MLAAEPPVWALFMQQVQTNGLNHELEAGAASESSHLLLGPVQVRPYCVWRSIHEGIAKKKKKKLCYAHFSLVSRHLLNKSCKESKLVNSGFSNLREMELSL